MKKIKFILVFLFLFFGVLIYFLYRSKNFYYYNFIYFLNINGYVFLVREIVILYRKLFLIWVIYLFLDGLWFFLIGVVFLIVRKKYFFYFFWFLFIYFFMVGIEYI